MMTEAEAKTKWCPMVRFVMQSGGAAYNRSEDGGPIIRTACIASACMAWRAEMIGDDANEPLVKTARGHCGLAGRP